MRIPLLVFVSVALTAHADPGLNSTVWSQSALEHRAICLQAYQQARHALDRALKDKKATAALEQSGNFRKLPPAIILDIDETVLDNGPSQARLILDKQEFTPENWGVWVEEAKAEALPGAVEFLRYAESRKVAVFFVTNREAKHEDATLSNLQRVGIAADRDHVHLLNEKPEWGSDKTTRRSAVAATHRIVMLFGDDLNDFLTGVRTTAAERMKVSTPYDAYWGSKWVMLPNPMYGSWESALYEPGKKLTPEDKLAAKRRALEARRP